MIINLIFFITMRDENLKILFETGVAIAQSNIAMGTRAAALMIAPEGTGFSEELVSEIESDSFFSEIACGPNCPYCCSMQIRITPPEALLVGEHVLTTYSDERIRNLKDRIMRNLELTDGKNQEEKVKNWHKTQCIFLEEGSCSLYEVRPFICRSWHSLDKAVCIKAYDDKKVSAEIENYPHRNSIFGTIRKGIISGCSAKGLQSGAMVITKAVLAILEHEGDAVTDWLSGAKVFPESAFV